MTNPHDGSHRGFMSEEEWNQLWDEYDAEKYDDNEFWWM